MESEPNELINYRKLRWRTKHHRTLFEDLHFSTVLIGRVEDWRAEFR